MVQYPSAFAPFPVAAPLDPRPPVENTELSVRTTRTSKSLDWLSGFVAMATEITGLNMLTSVGWDLEWWSWSLSFPVSE